MPAPSLNELLKQTSRSFYLTLRVLPGRVRQPIGLAYLLARTTDTIADSEIISPAQRLEALQKLRERILGNSTMPLNFGELARQQGLPAEQMLLERVEESLAALSRLEAEDLPLVRQVLETIISGQELDLRRFGGVSLAPPALTLGERENVAKASDGSVEQRNFATNLNTLATDAELDDYTYRVAGCVGEFWTRVCRRHLFPQAALNEPEFLANGIRFGKGLQLVNILRDLPADLRKGRCYLPVDKLRAAGLTATDLLVVTNEARFRPLYENYLNLAQSHLAAGWAYTNTIPWGQMRVRLACAWPILIGLETLQRLRVEPVLDPARRVKISRAQVRRIMLRSVWCYPFRAAWRAQAELAA